MSGPVRLMFEVAADRDLANRTFDHLVRSRFLGSSALIRGFHDRGGRKQQGTAGLRSLIEHRFIEGKPTDSQLEKAFNRLASAYDITGFEFHRRVRVGGRTWTPDFVHPELKIIVETDGREWHTQRIAFERDRDHDSLAAAHGWLTVRFTWHQVIFEPHVVAKRLTAIMRRRATS